ncbi:MAG: hypothetical protein Q7T24_01365 [Deltaproteobacteria bacterium]|nr:hypothetical protein [Deltaproteobacteria bacterium]
MVKIDPIAGQNCINTEKPVKRSLVQETQNPSGDAVTISEEGKRKHIMGHLLANLTEEKR